MPQFIEPYRNEKYIVSNPNDISKVLTNRQREVVELLYAGYSRPAIAQTLVPQVCTQAVHQIILRIRKRLSDKAGIYVKDGYIYHGNPTANAAT